MNGNGKKMKWHIQMKIKSIGQKVKNAGNK